MEQDYPIQTALDQMVGSDQEQFMKALIPYLSPKLQQFMALYTKASELANTAVLFQKQQTVEMQAASGPLQPLEQQKNLRSDSKYDDNDGNDKSNEQLLTGG